MTTTEALKQALEADYADLLEPSYPRVSEVEMARRTALLDAMIADADLSALIVSEGMFAGSATGWINGWPVTAEAVTLIVPGQKRRMFIQYYNHLPLAQEIARDVSVEWGEASALQRAADGVKVSGRGPPRVGLIGRITAGQAASLAARFSLVDMNAAYVRARLIKSDEEIRWLGLGAALTDLPMAALAQEARAGVSERELHGRIQAPYLPYGARNVIHFLHSTSMDAPDTAVPRQFASARRLVEGDVLSAELSVDYWGYSGQVLRTFFIGREPNALYRELHAAADAVLDAVLAAVKPGAHARDLVEASRRIEDSGFTVIDDLVHGYGGGYLPPVLGSHSRPAAGGIPDVTLKTNMALVVQPNVVTRDGKAGVQTGHLVVVTDQGARTLQRYPRGYQVVG